MGQTSILLRHIHLVVSGDHELLKLAQLYKQRIWKEGHGIVRITDHQTTIPCKAREGWRMVVCSPSINLSVYLSTWSYLSTYRARDLGLDIIGLIQLGPLLLAATAHIQQVHLADVIQSGLHVIQQLVGLTSCAGSHLLGQGFTASYNDALGLSVKRQTQKEEVTWCMSTSHSMFGFCFGLQAPLFLSIKQGSMICGGG